MRRQKKVLEIGVGGNEEILICVEKEQKKVTT
jgi:hypothetical protein